MFQRKGKAGMKFEYRGRDTHDRPRVVSGKALRYVTARGFKEEVFYTKKKMKKIPTLSSDSAAMERLIPHVVYAKTKANWPGFLQADNYACRWSGFLQIIRG